MNTIRLIVCIAMVTVLSGCDLGTYSKRYNDRVGKMTSMANSNKDLADQLIDIAGNAKIRVPKVCYNEDSLKFGPQDEFLKARIPGIEIEGFVSSFMGDKEAADGSWYPFQVYFFFMPGKNIEEAKSEVKAVVGSVLTQTRVSWEPKDMESYDGNEYVWNSATVGAGQPFLVYENNSEKQKTINGRLDLYLTDNDKGVLAVAFRAPASVFGYDDEHLVEGTLKSIQGFK